MPTLVAEWSERRGDLLAQVFRDPDHDAYKWVVVRVHPEEDEPHELFLDALLPAYKREEIGEGLLEDYGEAVAAASGFLEGYAAGKGSA